MTARLGVLGGTFDPVHFGHIDAAEAARDALGLTGVLFVPSHDPPHRAVDPHVSAYHRFALVALATDGRPGFRVSDIELLRQGRSYTADTLRSLHAVGWTPSQLFFILGADAFAEIATWHEFPEVLDAAHFAIVSRTGTAAEAALARLPELRSRVTRTSDHASASGETGLFLVEARTRDVSSTVIRRRIAARQPVDDLVPPPVARHMAAHHLYWAVPHRVDADGPLEGELHGDSTNDAGS